MVCGPAGFPPFCKGDFVPWVCLVLCGSGEVPRRNGCFSLQALFYSVWNVCTWVSGLFFFPFEGRLHLTKIKEGAGEEGDWWHIHGELDVGFLRPS